MIPVHMAVGNNLAIRNHIRIYIACTCILFNVVISSIADNETDEQRLLAHLFRNYDTAARPVFNGSKPVDVGISFSLSQLYDVDALKQQMKVIGWLEIEWFDEVLHWNPDDFGGMESIVMPSNKVWLPPFALDNSAGNVYNQDHFKFFMVTLDYEGYLYFEPGGQFTSLCTIEIQYYPFDIQTCQLTISGWDYPESLVNLTAGSDEIDLQTFQLSGEWTVLHTNIERESLVYDCCPEVQYPEIHLILNLQRKPGFYVTNIIIPCVLLVLLDLFVFVLPTESGEKIALGMTVLLAFSVFSLLIVEQVPRTSNGVPVIVQYLTFCMGMAGTSIVLSVLTLCIYHRKGNKKPPKFLMKYLVRETRTTSMKNEHYDVDINHGNNQTNNKMQTDETGTEKESYHEIKTLVQTFEEREKEKQEHSETTENWRTLADKVEKICLVLFIIINIIAPIAILYVLPSLQSK